MHRTTIGRPAHTMIVALLLAALVCAFPRSVNATSGAPPRATHPWARPVQNQAFRTADATLRKLTAQGLFSGAVLVAQKGVVLFSQGYGMANRQQHVPITARTQFRIGTSTNQFTALAILQLQAQGKLHVQDHICRYVIPCIAAWRSITIHQLLTHTSGMDDFLDPSLPLADGTKPATPRQIVIGAKVTPLLARPGSTWSYSNMGYWVLGSIIEQVSHRSYGSFLQTDIFTPAQMGHSGYNDTLTKPALLATGYPTGSDTPADYIDMSTAFSAAGVYSTVGDLYRWDQALATFKVASARIQNQMYTAYWSFCQDAACQTITPGPEWGFKTAVSRAGYGYGWGVARLQRTHHRLFAAAGGFNGDLPYNGRYPDDKVDIIVLTNQSDVDMATVVQVLERSVLATR